MVCHIAIGARNGGNILKVAKGWLRLSFSLSHQKLIYQLFITPYSFLPASKPMAINPDQPIYFCTQHRLQWEEAQQKHVILYPEGMVELNQSSAEILKLCDGSRHLAQLVNELETKFATTGLTNDITAFLEVALTNGWINQH